MRVRFFLFFVFFLLYAGFAVEENFTKYWQNLNTDHDYVRAIVDAQRDAWQFGDESWWMVVYYIIFAVSLAIVSKNEGVVGFGCFLGLVFFNSEFPKAFFLPALVFNVALLVKSITTVRGE